MPVGGKNLAVRFRPKRFSEVVGNAPVISALKKLYSGNSYFLSGDTGVGKTTLARILATSAQCTHQTTGYGEPCDGCITMAEEGKFDIMEINASDATGVEEIRALTKGYSYSPMPPSCRRVYILDEAHRLSTASQNLLLKSLEDGPASALWIICTTEPSKVLRTLRGRCLPFALRSLGYEEVGVLVQRVLAFTGKKVPEEATARFSQALERRSILQPRAIVNLVEMFLTGKVTWPVAEGVTRKLGQYLLEGNWEVIRKALSAMEAEDIEGLRLQLSAYMGVVLLGKSWGPEAERVRMIVGELTFTSLPEPSQQKVRTIVGLYQACRLVKQMREESLG